MRRAALLLTIALGGCLSLFGEEPVDAPPAPAPDEPRCGDGVVQRELGERCDPGERPDERCSSRCQEPRCGDGVVQPELAEVCDEGDGGPGDRADGVLNGDEQTDCAETCQPKLRCGNGVIDDGEACDAGAANDDHHGRCTTRCAPPACGDGLLQWAEACDPGVDRGCRLDCLLASDGCGAAQVVAGGGAGWVLRTDGALLAFGAGVADGGADAARPIVIAPPEGVRWRRIAAGPGLLFAIASDGRLFARGDNSHGALGTGDLLPAAGWRELELAHAAREVSVGRSFAVALDEAGGLSSVGSNEFGKLGRGLLADERLDCPAEDATFMDCDPPPGIPSSSPCGCHPSILCNGSLCAQVTSANGSSGNPGWCEENDRDCTERNRALCPMTTCVAGVVPILEAARWLSVEAGADAVFAISNKGTLFSWGRNRNRDTGRANSSGGCMYCYELPVELSDPAPVFELAAGPRHSIAIDQRGSVWGWGFNGGGQLGPGAGSDKVLPLKLSLLPDAPAARFVRAAGGERDVSYLLDDAGTLYSLGADRSGQLGAGAPAGDGARRVTIEGERIVELAAGDGFVAVRTATGRVFTFGDAADGRLGRAVRGEFDPTPGEVTLCP